MEGTASIEHISKIIMEGDTDGKTAGDRWDK